MKYDHLASRHHRHFLPVPWLEEKDRRSSFRLTHTFCCGCRRRLSLIVLITFGAGLIASFIRYDTVVSALWPLQQGRHILTPLSLILLLVMGIPALLCLFLYWGRLVSPHRLNTLIFACLAPWDARFLAMFGMVAAVLLSATVFRKSVDSERLRAAFKHAE